MQAHRGSDDEPPTLRPPFDPATFARDSERALRAEETTDESARPTQRPPPPGGRSTYPEDRTAEGGQLLVRLSVDDGDVPFLAVAIENIRGMPLSPIARTFLRYLNERDSVAVICSRAGLRMDEAVIAIEELSGAGVVSFQRSTRYSSVKEP